MKAREFIKSIGWDESYWSIETLNFFSGKFSLPSIPSFESELPTGFEDAVQFWGCYLIFCRNNGIESNSYARIIKVGSQYMISLKDAFSSVPLGFFWTFTYASTICRIEDGEAIFKVLVDQNTKRIYVGKWFLETSSISDLIDKKVTLN